jgi:hypothetical protein
MRSEYLPGETPWFAREKPGFVCGIQRKRFQRGGSQPRAYVLFELIMIGLQGHFLVGPTVVGGIVQQCIQAGDSQSVQPTRRLQWRVDRSTCLERRDVRSAHRRMRSQRLEPMGSRVTVSLRQIAT